MIKAQIRVRQIRGEAGAFRRFPPVIPLQIGENAARTLTRHQMLDLKALAAAQRPGESNAAFSRIKERGVQLAGDILLDHKRVKPRPSGAVKETEGVAVSECAVGQEFHDLAPEHEQAPVQLCAVKQPHEAAAAES